MAAGEEAEQLSGLRQRLDDEQQRMAELRRRVEQATARSNSLKERMIRDRRNAAAQAEVVADQAEAFADHLEAAAAGRAGDPRLELAKREREIAALERRNAAKLRDEGVGPLHLETPPPLHDESGA